MYTLFHKDQCFLTLFYMFIIQIFLDFFSYSKTKPLVCKILYTIAGQHLTKYTRLIRNWILKKFPLQLFSKRSLMGLMVYPHGFPTNSSVHRQWALSCGSDAFHDHTQYCLSAPPWLTYQTVVKINFSEIKKTDIHKNL